MGDAVVIVGVVGTRIFGFDGDMKLARSNGSVEGVLVCVVIGGEVEMEFWPGLLWNCQVSGTTIKT